LGEIPEPTVKVRMRENQRVVDASIVNGFNKATVRRLVPLFPPRDATSVSEKGVENEPST
jgi:hypothetical protein